MNQQQETSSRGSYLTIAANIVTKITCCTNQNETHSRTNAHNIQTANEKVEGEGVDVPISLESSEPP